MDVEGAEHMSRFQEWQTETRGRTGGISIKYIHYQQIILHIPLVLIHQNMFQYSLVLNTDDINCSTKNHKLCK